MRYFILALLASISVGMPAANQRVIRTLRFDSRKLSISSVECKNGTIYSQLEYEGIDTKTEEPGMPELPIYYLNVPLPLGASQIDVKVQNKNRMVFELDYPVFPVQEQATTSLLSNESSFTDPDNKIYTQDIQFPENTASVAWTLNRAGVNNEVVIAIYPLVYSPRLNKVELSQSLTISINYSIEKNYRNKQAMQTLSSIGLPFYEYCIITRDSLIPSFERIIAWKRTKGIDAGAVSIESILSNSYCSGDTVSGINDDAGKVRQYLQYAYQSGKGKYVFFGGNYTNLPIRYGTASFNTWYYAKIWDAGNVPTDQYYSDLDSNWNRDNDNYYGEPYTMDFNPELFVGRLLCENNKDIENNTDKLLRYERNPGNGDFGYLRNAFYCQSDQMQENNQAQNLINTCNDVFTTNTILSEYPSADDMNPSFPTGTQVVDSMNIAHYGYMNWMGHGHPFAIATKTDSIQKANTYAITSVQADTIPYIRRENGNGIDNLNNRDYPAIVYSISCTITPFDIYRPVYSGHPNIGQSFTLGKDYGGPALIGNTRIGLVGYSYRLQKLFNGKMKTFSLGEALSYAKRDYNSGAKHLMALTTNLIGCPELHMWTNIPNYFGNIVKTDSNTSDTNLSFTAYSDTVEVAIRDVWGNDDVTLYTFHPSYSNLTIPNGKGKLITLKALNHIPEILHLENGSATVHGRRYVYASSATLGGEANSTFTVDNDADITIEKTGVLRLSSGFKVKQGARFVVR